MSNLTSVYELEISRAKQSQSTNNVGPGLRLRAVAKAWQNSKDKQRKASQLQSGIWGKEGIVIRLSFPGPLAALAVSEVRKKLAQTNPGIVTAAVSKHTKCNA